MKKNIFSSGILLPMTLFMFTCSYFNSNAQATLKSGISFPSSLGHGDSEDWPLSIIQSSDCLHYYFAGFSQYHDENNGCGNDDMVRAPIIGKLNPITGELLWEREYNVVIGYGNFTKIFEADDGFLWALGGQQKTPCVFSSWSMFIVKVDPQTGDPEPGYPKFFDPDLDHNSSTTDVLQSRIFGSDPLYSNGNFDGFVSSGRAQKNGETFNRAMISKTNADGTPDTDFGTNGYYFGPASSEARTVIQITGFSGIQFVYVGDINVSATDKDVLVEAIDEDGQLVWSQQFSEANLSSVYSDDTQNDASVCSNLTSPGFENEIERGWDVIQDGDALYLSCMFDVLDLSGTAKDNQCPEYIPYDFYMNVDVALLKIELTDGNPVKASNPAQFEASDFYPDIEIKNGSLYLLGARTTYENDEVKTKTVVLTLNTDLEVEHEKQFNTLGEINCSFDLNFNCEDEMIVTGNNEINEEDYYFYKLSNGCQSQTGFDISSNQTITSNTTWNSSAVVGATIRIQACTLTINSGAVIEFGASWDLVDYNVLAENNNNAKAPRIIVEPGAALILDNCTLRGLASCSNNAMWDGVEVQNGAIINLSNGAIIMDAKYGILADMGSYNANGHLNPTESSGGGIVQSNNASILNCRRGIHFAHCTSNPSSLSSTTFACNGYLKDPSYKTFYTPVSSSEGFVQRLGTSIFVSSNVASGMNFSACDWLTSVDLPPDLRGIGISGYNAAYTFNGACTMTGLNAGISAQNSDPLKFIYVSGNNQFIGNKTGILLRGGHLHKIIGQNYFETQMDYNTEILPVQTAVGIYNAGAAKVLIEENTFTAGSTAEQSHTYGIISENTGSAASLHKKNEFLNMAFGEQTQRNNAGINLWCNEHDENGRAWSINPQTPGAFQNQGFCLPQGALTPENKFFDPPCATPLNHIFSTHGFTYWVKSGESNVPICNSLSVVIDDCNNNNAESGCDARLEINAGNEQEYLYLVATLPEGTQRQLLVNELLRYYIGVNHTENILTLLENESNELYKMMLAQVLLEQDQINEAQAIVNGLSSGSPETADFSQFFSVLAYAKVNDLSLAKLPNIQLGVLENLSDHRSLAAYKAQAILQQYYGQEYLLPLESETGIDFRGKDRNTMKTATDFFQLSPNPASDHLELNLTIQPKSDLVFYLKDLNGKFYFTGYVLRSQQKTQLDLQQLPPGIYLCGLKDEHGMLHHQKFIKH